jgi:hypothetical protein
MVAFVDPRKSKIDIAQAAGRAMRQSKATNKKLGYIVVPLFIEQKKGETEAEAFTRAGFDEVAEVLGAMLESDDDLVDTIEKMQEARGRGDKFNPRQLHEKIEVIGPSINLDKLTQSIDVEILDRLGVSWDRWSGLLQKFHKREGHCRVAQNFIEDGLVLGSWIKSQRASKIKNEISAERVEKLNSIGFSWDPYSEDWENGFNVLQEFRKREGHCRVPPNFKEDEFTLGSWVYVQRIFREKRTLDPERIKRLDAIGFSWDPHTEKWEDGFATLTKFRRREGHCRVPQHYKEGEYALGTWTKTQRVYRNKGILSPERIKRLDSINFSWDPNTEKWDTGFSILKKFRIREGHCQVPHGFKEGNFSLGNWVMTQRILKEKGGLDIARVNRLDSVGFSWKPKTENWNKAFSALLKFKKREGHCLVPFVQKEGNIALGNWVMTQRMLRKNGKIDPVRLKRLNSIGFNWKG